VLRSRLARMVLAGTATIATALMSSAPVMADASNWKVGYYTPSSVGTLSFANAKPGGGIASLDFTTQNNTALLVTTHGAFKGESLGDIAGKTITATFDVSGLTGDFTYFGEPSCGGTTANARFFFQTDNGGGFQFTHYWWSDAASTALANGTFTLTAKVEPAGWSDWNGQLGVDQAAGYMDAASNVKTIGLSFGGGCFFENGVGTTDGGGTFTLDTFTVS
jgi:hypothetical protein